MKWQGLPASAFDDWADAWDALNAAGPRLPFFDARFIAAALDAFGHPGLRLVVGQDAHGVGAIGLFDPGPRLGWQARWQTSWQTSWHTWQPSQLPLGAWLARPGGSPHHAARAVMRALPGLPLCVGFTQQDPQLTPRVEGPGHSLDYVATARVMIEGRFEDYWAARGKNLRHNVKRQHAKLAAQGQHARLDCLTARETMAEAIHQYGTLEAASWKAAQGTAITPDNAQGRFYRDLLERFADTAQARVYRYCIDEAVVAMDLCLTQGEALVMLKTACADTLPGLSPAVLMHHDVFATLFDQGEISRVEFFGKVMEWHTRWTEDTRMLYHANFYRPHWLGRLKNRLAHPAAA
jgi:hypothetical protein